MNRYTLIVMVAVLTSPALAQLSPAEAQEKLIERDKLRDRQREQMVEIKAGDLEDLRARLAQLEAEVRTLRASSSTKPAAPKRVRTEIEVGMTRAELDAFVRSRNLKLMGTSTSAAGGAKQEELRFARVVSGSRQVGTRRNALGQQVPVYENTEGTEGKVLVTLADGVVVAVSAK